MGEWVCVCEWVIVNIALHFVFASYYLHVCVLLCQNWI